MNSTPHTSASGKMRLALAMGVVLILLGGLVFWDDWKTTKDEKAKAEQNKLVTLTDDQVSEIHYESLGATDSFDAAPNAQAKPVSVHVIKKDGAWRISAPLDAKADEQAVKGLIATIRDYKYDKAVSEDKGRWKDFGLDPPNRRVNLIYTKDGKQTNLEVLVGAKAPVGYSAYVAINGEPKVYLGSQHIITSANKTLADFRDKTVLTIDEASVKSMVYAAAGHPQIEWTKTDSHYEIKKPIQVAADDNSIKGLVDDLNKLKATDFIDAPDAAAVISFTKLAEVGHVTWVTSNGTATTLVVRGTDKELQAAFDPKSLIMKLPDDSRMKFAKKLIDFRDRRVVALQSKNAVSVEVDGQIFKKAKEDWYGATEAAATPPQGKPKSYVQSLLVDLEFAKAEDIFETSDKRAKDTAAAPTHRIKIEFAPESKESPLIIESWDVANAPGKILLRQSGSKQLYIAPKTALANTSETSIRASDDKSAPLNLGKMDDPAGSPMNGSDSAN